MEFDQQYGKGTMIINSVVCHIWKNLCVVLIFRIAIVVAIEWQ